MKRLIVSTLALLLLVPAALAQVTTYKDIKTPSLRAFSMPQPKRVALPNGLVIFLQEDHELPLIAGTAVIRGGGRDIPADKAGMLGIYSGAWRTGGTTTRPGEQLDEFLEARAARVEVSGDTDSTRVSMDILKGDLEAVFPIWLDVLKNPAFPQVKIDLAKTQINTGISRRNDDPGAILSREAAKLGYGADSPYTRQAEYATVASITRDDLLAFHKRTVHPNNIIVSFIGDFDAAKMEKRLRDAFAGWPKGPQIAKPNAALTGAKPGLYFVSKEDVTQGNIAMVHPGITRDNPDYYSVVVMNEVFGGGFSGRLMQTLRSQRGLTYGVGGGLGANWDYPGLFRVSMATKSETTLESVQALREEVNKLTTTPVTDAELSLAKESILNAYVFTMDTRAKALNQRVLLEFYGFPADYFVKYPSMIEKVTAADVQRVAQKYVQPNQLAVLVVGNEKAFEKPLSTLGSVTPIDVTIPEGDAKKPAAAAATTGSNAEGVALVKKVAAFVGNVSSVQSLGRTGSMQMNTPQGMMDAEINSLTRYPNSSRVVMNMAMGQITRVVSPEGAFVITPMGTQDLPSSQRDAALNDMKAELVTVLRNLDNPKYTFTATGTEKIGDVEARVVEVNADGQHVKWSVDPATGKLLRSVSHASGPMPGDVVTDYTEWKAFGGINFPVATAITRNGEKAGGMKLTNVEINPTVPADAFTKK
jgi:zinc protease